MSFAGKKPFSVNVIHGFCFPFSISGHTGGHLLVAPWEISREGSVLFCCCFQEINGYKKLAKWLYIPAYKWNLILFLKTKDTCDLLNFFFFLNYSEVLWNIVLGIWSKVFHSFWKFPPTPSLHHYEILMALHVSVVYLGVLRFIWTSQNTWLSFFLLYLLSGSGTWLLFFLSKCNVCVKLVGDEA